MPIEFRSKIKYVYQILNRPLKEFYKYITTGTGGFEHYIGEEFGGGIVFSLWKDENGIERGLILAKNPLNNSLSGTARYSSTATLIGQTAQSFTDGQSNTAAIVAQGPAISSALDVQDYSEGGYTDWYMGSTAEYAEILNNRLILAEALEKAGGFPLSTSRTFITSNEVNATTCNVIAVSNFNITAAIPKTSNIADYFTPIRKF